MDSQYTCFSRYLASKKTVDDRALNRNVWDALAHALHNTTGQAPLRVLEIGCGIGTMVERALDWGLFAAGQAVEYIAIDSEATNIQVLEHRLGKRTLDEVRVSAEAIDLFDFLARPHAPFDVLIAHAFLDLMDIAATLPKLHAILKPGGLCYYTINFDGVTSLEPQINRTLDDTIEALYHQTMDNRITAGHPSGDSRAGRHLIHHMRQSGCDVLAAGSSDWVVFSQPDGSYVGDEAYFLHFIVDTMAGALDEHPQLNAETFAAWRKARHAQIDAGDLLYIAHQTDLLGRVCPAPGAE